MKILHVVSQYPPAPGYGVARALGDLSETLAARGHEVHILSSAVQEENEPGAAEKTPRVHGPTRKYPFFAYNETLENVLQTLPTAERLVAEWETSGPFEVLVAHDWQSAQVATLGQRVIGAPLVAAFHGTQVGRLSGKGSPEDIYTCEMERWLADRADRIVVPSLAVLRECEESYRVSAEKISVIPEAPRPETFKAEIDREEFRSMFAERGERLVLFAGRFAQEKGLAFLLEAIPVVLRREGGVRFVLAGDGPLRASLQESVKKAGLQERVRFTGHLGPKVLGALYQVSNLLVLPSLYEASGITALEALAHELPVVASNVGGLRELAARIKSDQVRLAEPGSSQSLSASILSVLGRPETTASAFRAARELPDPYSPARMSEGWLRVFEEARSAAVR